MLREATGAETLEYAIAAALLVAGVLIGFCGIALAVAPIAQGAVHTVFGI
jgi:hypothetical protein